MKKQSIKMWCMVNRENRLFLLGGNPMIFTDKETGEWLKKYVNQLKYTKIKPCKIII